MRRRELIVLLGAAVAWPIAAREQQSVGPMIGFLHSGSADKNVARLDAFRKGLSEAGFVDGKNVAIEFRWANGETDKLPAMAADLVKRQPAVIVTAGSTPATVVAKSATSSIPIVFATGADPVALGFVESLNRPGGNITGVTSLNAELAAKWLGLFRGLASRATHYFAVVNAASALSKPFIRDLETGAKSLGINVDILRASSESEIDAAFAGVPQQSGNVLMFGPNSLFYTRREQIAALARRKAALTIFDDREYAVAGGLMTYGADWSNLTELAGGYTGRILKGEKPADLPVIRATKYEMVINLKTAKTLGLEMPPTLLATADEVIE